MVRKPAQPHSPGDGAAPKNLDWKSNTSLSQISAITPKKHATCHEAIRINGFAAEAGLQL